MSVLSLAEGSQYSSRVACQLQCIYLPDREPYRPTQISRLMEKNILHCWLLDTRGLFTIQRQNVSNLFVGVALTQTCELIVVNISFLVQLRFYLSVIKEDTHFNIVFWDKNVLQNYCACCLLYLFINVILVKIFLGRNIIHDFWSDNFCK